MQQRVVWSSWAEWRALYADLFALDDAGRMAWRYHGNLRWVPMIESEVSAPVAELVA